MNTMQNVAVVGDGAREHALGKKLSESSQVNTVFFIPGNAGTASCGQNRTIDQNDFPAIRDFCKHNAIGLVVIGPDRPLAEGITDFLKEAGIVVFGPSKKAAQLEASKAFAKTFMSDFNIPTAPFDIFDNYYRALTHVRSRPLPFFIKASGLAAGKGAIPCHTVREAEIALWKMMRSDAYGTAGEVVVVEDFVDGEEYSVHAICDGKTFIRFPFSKDYKRVAQGSDLMTGGMGALGPVPLMGTNGIVINDIIAKTLVALNARGARFSGLLYPGIMLTPNGPQVLEYNVRFGDPEAQVYMRLLKSDLYELLLACAQGNLANVKVQWCEGYAVCIVLASGGYPKSYRTGFPITGITMAERIPSVVIFHAGTAWRQDGMLITAAGRVLSVTAVGDTLQEASDRAYRAASYIDFEGKYCRRRIGATPVHA